MSSSVSLSRFYVLSKEYNFSNLIRSGLPRSDAIESHFVCSELTILFFFVFADTYRILSNCPCDRMINDSLSRCGGGGSGSFDRQDSPVIFFS